MTAIELLRVDPGDMPHAQREIACDDFHKQVVAIAH
jgi:hypothetical protein